MRPDEEHISKCAHTICLATEKCVLGMKFRAMVCTMGCTHHKGEAKWSVSLAWFPCLDSGKRSIFSLPVSFHSFMSPHDHEMMSAYVISIYYFKQDERVSQLASVS